MSMRSFFWFLILPVSLHSAGYAARPLTPPPGVSCEAPLLGQGLWKLIRDGLPAIYAADGEVYTMATATRAQMGRLLIWKFTEELGEFYTTPVIEEMADVREVLLAIESHHGFEPIILEAIRTVLPVPGIERPVRSLDLIGALKTFNLHPSHDHLAALQVLVNGLEKQFHLDPARVEAARLRKLSAKGGFTKGYVLKVPL